MLRTSSEEIPATGNHSRQSLLKSLASVFAFTFASIIQSCDPPNTSAAEPPKGMTPNRAVVEEGNNDRKHLDVRKMCDTIAADNTLRQAGEIAGWSEENINEIRMLYAKVQDEPEEELESKKLTTLLLQLMEDVRAQQDKDITNKEVIILLFALLVVLSLASYAGACRNISPNEIDS